MPMPDNREKRLSGLHQIQQNNMIDGVSPGEAMLIGMGAGMTSIAQEAGTLGSAIAEKSFGLLPEGTTQARMERIQPERDFYNKTPVAQSSEGKTGKFLGEVLPTIVIPGGVVGGVARKAVTGAIGGGIVGALQPTEDTTSVMNENRVINTLAGTAFGAAFPLGIAAAKYGTKTGANIVQMFTKSGGRAALKKGIIEGGGEAAYMHGTRAARNLDTFLSPGEATNFNELISREKGMVLSNDLMTKLGVDIRKRTDTLHESIKEVIENMAPDTPERAKLVQEGYEALAATRMSPKLIKAITKDDPVMSREYKRFINDKDYKPFIDSVPEDSMAVLDKFQKYLNDRKEVLFRKGKGEVADVIKGKREAIRDLLDVTVPEYAVARREAQLNIMKRNLNKGIDSLKTAARDAEGNPVTTPVQFYQKFLKSDEDFSKIIDNLQDNPEAVQKFTDLRTVLSGIEGSPLEKAFARREPLQTARTGGLGLFPGLLLFESIGAVRHRFNEGIIEAVTDPSFSAEALQEAARLAKSGTPEGIRAAAEALVKFSARGLAKDSSEPTPHTEAADQGDNNKPARSSLHNQ